MTAPDSSGDQALSRSFLVQMNSNNNELPPDTVIIKNDSASSSDSNSSGSNTLGSASASASASAASSSRHQLRSRNSFARRRREPAGTAMNTATAVTSAVAESPSPPLILRKQISTATTTKSNTNNHINRNSNSSRKDSKRQAAQQKPKGSRRRRIVIGTHTILPRRLRLIFMRLTPAYVLFMKLRARYKLCCALLTLLLYVSCRKSIRRARINYFGLHPIHGGSLGVKWDRQNIQRVMEETRRAKNAELEELGVVLPPTEPPGSLLDIDTHAALREHLVRREARSQHLIHMEAMAELYQRGCTDDGVDLVVDNTISATSNQNNNNHRGGGGGEPAVSLIMHSLFATKHKSLANGSIPKHVFIPDVVSWQRPRPAKPSSLVHLTFDIMEMRLLIADNYLPLLGTFDSLKSEQDKIYLWSICALYFYGGVFMGPHAVWHAQLIANMMESPSTTTSALFDQSHSHGEQQEGQQHCSSSPKGLAVFSKSDRASSQTESGSSLNVLLLATTPRHPHLRCVMNQLESADGVDASRLLQSFFLQDSWESSHTYHHLTNNANHQAPWELLTTQCSYGHAHTQECCHGMNFHEVQDLPAQDEDDGTVLQQQGKLYVQMLELSDYTEHDNARTATVHIAEQAGTEAPVKSEKVYLEDVMTRENIAPGWLCTRCLKTSLYGTLEACAKVCNSGYEDLLCYAPDKPEKAEVVVEVTVNTTADPSANARIPRIIHQTWFEDLSSDRYPELVRLQNSWKRSNWEYRFYTDEDARSFIVENFPPRFADAFDALIPGAYKADLFRYLVLLKEGGVYADVDILLDASLDEFVTPSLSFFAPRDVVCEYADESFCLWNGIIGSAPGHPFLIRAVERLVNLILERADLYDMERDVCRRIGRTMENWKVRSEPLLLASGPCALGVAVNDMIGHDSLAKLDIGWIPSDAIQYGKGHDHGDALILVGDKFDLGSFRISDPERSYILASTDLPGVTKESRELSNPTRGEMRRRQHRRGPLPHYSEAAKGEFIWGMHNVYHDNLVNNEVLKFNVVYN